MLESRKRFDGRYRRFECQTGHRWSVLERSTDTPPVVDNAKAPLED